MANLNRMDYIGSNPDWAKFQNQVSDNTGAHYRKLWKANSKANRERVLHAGWAAEDLLDIGINKTAVLLGASPALRKQVNTLKELRADPNFIFIGVSSGLRFFLENDINPDYVMVADASPTVSKWFKDLEEKTGDMTLIANVCCQPSLLDMWQGPVKYLAIWTTIKGLDKQLNELYRPINGCGYFFPALMSQYNTGTALAYLVFGCKVLIFVGNEMGFADEKVPYYVDRTDKKDKWVRKPHPDIYGNVYYTNYMFMSLKQGLEDFLGKLPGWFFNCTEDGIFGVSKRYGNLPWIFQLTLDMGIKQARHIMQTGKPITVDSVLEDYLKEVKKNERFQCVMPTF